MTEIVDGIPLADRVNDTTCRLAFDRIDDEKFSEDSFLNQEEDFRTVKEACLRQIRNKYAVYMRETGPGGSNRECVRNIGRDCLG